MEHETSYMEKTATKCGDKTEDLRSICVLLYHYTTLYYKAIHILVLHQPSLCKIVLLQNCAFAKGIFSDIMV